MSVSCEQPTITLVSVGIKETIYAVARPFLTQVTGRRANTVAGSLIRSDALVAAGRRRFLVARCFRPRLSASGGCRPPSLWLGVVHASSQRFSVGLRAQAAASCILPLPPMLSCAPHRSLALGSPLTRIRRGGGCGADHAAVNSGAGGGGDFNDYAEPGPVIPPSRVSRARRAQQTYLQFIYLLDLNRPFFMKPS